MKSHLEEEKYEIKKADEGVKKSAPREGLEGTQPAALKMTHLLFKAAEEKELPATTGNLGIH